MTSRRATLLAIAWLLLAVVAGLATRAARQQRAERETLAAQVRQLEVEAAALRREHSSAATELAHAESQLAALPLSKAENPAITPARRTEINAWLGRVKRLRGHFDDHPNERIPEMRLLEDEAWLRVAQSNVDFENEEHFRQALAFVRSAAISHFMNQISAAAQKYLASGKTERPASVQVLAAYFDQPVDPAMLARYEITNRSQALRSGAVDWGVQNKDPIDPDYDVRQHTSPRGGGSSNSGLMAWVPGLQERYQQAMRNYTRAHPGETPRGAAKIIPFFDPPLEPDLAARLIRTDRSP